MIPANEFIDLSTIPASDSIRKRFRKIWMLPGTPNNWKAEIKMFLREVREVRIEGYRGTDRFFICKRYPECFVFVTDNLKSEIKQVFNRKHFDEVIDTCCDDAKESAAATTSENKREGQINLSTIQIPKSHPLDRFGERWHRSHSPSDRERIARRLLSDVNEIKKEPIWSTLSLINHGPGRFFVNRHDKSIVFVTNEEATVLVTVLNRKDRPRGWVDPLSPGKKRKKWR